MPKRNKRVVSSVGEGKVIDSYPLRQSVIVELDSGERNEFPSDELQPWDELEALRRKSQQPCDRHQNGGCDCGKAATKVEELDSVEVQPGTDAELPEKRQGFNKRSQSRKPKKSKRKKPL